MDDMDITQFTIRILLLFVPGIICSFCVDALTEHRPREPLFFIIRSLVLGFASYFFYWVLLLGLNHFEMLPEINGAGMPISSKVYFLKALVDPSAPVCFHEILYVCALSVLLGIFLTLESTYKLTNKLFRLLHVTRKFGEIDVWGFALNLPGVKWVTVRDLREDLVYDGYIQAFSDDGVDAELLLLDVNVYRNSADELLYHVDALYVSRDRRTIVLEFRDVPDKVNAVISDQEVNNATTTTTDDGGNRKEGGG
jgi:hypothetical protein